jgi:hypothetical protein
VLAALGAPSAALACSDLDQTISTIVSGPILSTGGSITVNGAGAINGGPDGIDAVTCSISTLSNSGTVGGGAGGASAAGGGGVFSAQTITTLTNGGTIKAEPVEQAEGTFRPVARAVRAVGACQTPAQSSR